MKRLLLALALLASPAVLLAQNALPTLISYHGRVTDSAGVPIGSNNGVAAPTNREVHFKIYNHKTDSANANRLYSEKQTVTIANGEFSVLIGSGTVPAVTGAANLVASLDLAFNPASGTGLIDRYLGISVADANGVMGQEISPRQQIVTTAFALRAKVAEGLSGAITGSQIAAGSITAAQIAPATITSAQIATGTIGGTQIGDRSIGGIDLAIGTIGATELQDGSVVSAKIGSQAVTFGKIDVGAVSTPTIVDGAVTSVKIGDLQVTGAKIAAGTITADKLAAGAGSTSAYTSQVSITSAPIRGNVDGTTTPAYSEHLLIRGNATKDNFLALGYIDAAGTGAGTGGYSVLQGHYRAVEWTPLKLNPNGGAVSVGADGLSVAGTTTLSGYTTLEGGFRADRGFNVNANGIVGTTALIQTGKHPNQPTVEDTRILVLRDFAGTDKFTFEKTGVFTATGNVFMQNSAVVSGFLGVGGEVAGTHMVTIKSIASTLGAIIAKNSAGGTIFGVDQYGNVYSATNIFSNSDARLKKNIKPLVGALDKLLSLRSVTYDWINPADPARRGDTGFIAQEVELVYPEWVRDGPDGMKQLGAKGFEAMAVQALRELRAEKDTQLQQRDVTIAALEKNVAAMKSEGDETKARLATLERSLAALTARASN